MIAGCWLRVGSRYIARYCQPVQSALLILAVFLGPPIAFAADSLDREVTLDIPVQQLAKALIQFARQANVQVMVNGTSADAQTSSELKGTIPARAALDTLLRGSGLYYKVKDNTLIIAPTRVSEASSMQPFRVAGGSQTVPSDGAGAFDGSSDNAGQDQSSDIRQHKDKTLGNVVLEEVVVTGTHIRGIDSRSFQLQAIDREAIDRSGFTTVAQLIGSLPANFSGGVNVDTRSAGLVNGAADSNRGSASAINLLGLGSDATLVLLNGHRLPPASQGASVDISAIPLNLIDRVEILKEGASSIYGSDAVAGVVNFITRQNFDGAETRVTGSSVTSGNKRDYDVSQALGTRWNSGGLFGSYSYRNQGSLAASDRAFSKTAPAPSDLIPQSTLNTVYLSGNQDVGTRAKLTGNVLFTNRITTSVGTILSGSIDDILRSSSNNDALMASLDSVYRLTDSWDLFATGAYTDDSTAYSTAGNIRPTDFAFIKYKGETESIDVRADGVAVPLPGGDLRGAVGVAYRDESYAALLSTFGGDYRESRHLYSAYSEWFVPIVGEANSMPALRRLNLTVSGRYDKYSDFGSKATPHVGLVWAPISMVTVRASYSTSYVAPDLYELQQGSQANVLLHVPYPALPSGSAVALFRIGGNSALQAESARTFTAGMALDPPPQYAPHIGLNYFHVSFDNRIAQPGGGTLISTAPATYAAFLTPNPTAAEVDAITSLPNFINRFGPFVPSQVQLIADERLHNFDAVMVQGIDVAFSQDMELRYGRIQTSFDGTYLIKYDEVLTPGASSISRLNTPYYPVGVRFRAGFNWVEGGWSSSAFVNYVGKYTDTRMVAQPSGIPSWTTVDAQIAYAISPAFPGILSGSSVALSVLNLFDKAAPFVRNTSTTSETSFGQNYDPANASPLGRYVSLRLTKRW